MLVSFPFMSILPCVDIYNTFSFEPMHDLSLGISKLSKDCLVRYLKDESRFSGSMTMVKRAAKWSSQIWRTTLIAVKGFLWLLERTFPGHGVASRLLYGRLWGAANGLFK